MPSRFPDPARFPPPRASGERVLTRPLTLFLVAVALTMLLALRDKYPRPGVDTAITLLADGDLDGDERERMLRQVISGALHSDAIGHHWAGMLAAIGVDDQRTFELLRTRLGAGPTPDRAPPPEERQFLHLGDPVLGNVAKAYLAEVEQDHTRARALWQQVEVQCRLSQRGLAAALAAAARRRLG